MVRFVTYFLISVVWAGCGLFSNKEGRRPVGPEVRDVPFQARASDQMRKRIMVLPFLNSDLKRSAQVASVARQSVVRALQKTEQFVVIRNEDFPKDLTRFGSNQEFDLEAISKIAANMGLVAIMEGKILKVDIRKVGDPIGVFRKIKVAINTTVRIRVVSTRNTKEILNEERTADMETTTLHLGEKADMESLLQEEPELIDRVVNKAFEQLVRPIVRSVDKLSWEGRVALVSGEKIYLNAGRLSGLQIGDILRVTEEAEEVYDPETGLLIGQVPGRMKGTIEVISYFGQDGAVAILHSGSGVSENDRVEVY